MPLLIDRQVVDSDNWLLAEEVDALDLAGDLLVPLALYLEQRDALSAREGKVAVRINGDDKLEPVLEALDSFPMIAIEFPAFRDGRGFSLARILRRSGFTGELRAVGEFGRDQLGYLERCGFNAFEIPAERFDESLLNHFGEISVRYQGSADDPRPIYQQG